MKKIFFTLLMLAAFLTGYTQMNNNGGYITVESGATLVIEGDYTSTSSGTIEIDGDVVLKGDFVNNSGSIAAGSTGDLIFNGTAAQEITGSQSTTFYCGVEVDNAAGVALTNTQTGNHQTLANTLTLTNGMLTLNEFNLSMSSSGITGASSTNFIVTNGTGRLIGTVPVSGSLTYPVGYGTGASNYAPVTLANADVADVFAVQVKDGLLDNCGSGSPITDDVVTLRWDIDPSGGSATEADVTLSWDASQEDGSFDNTDCSVIHCDAGDYTAVGGYGDGSSHSISGTNITDFSWFGVGGGSFGSILASAKIFLQGAYNGTNLNSELRTDGLLPANQAYSNAIFDGSHLDYDGAETNGSLPANAVDWVLVELRTGTAAATSVGTTAALLLDDGSVVAYSGSGSVPFKGLSPASYYIAVHHRNHLSVLSSSAVGMNRSSASSYDFTTALTQAYDNPAITTNDQMVNLGSGVYGLWAGDCNFNNVTSYTGGSNDKNSILNMVGLTDPTVPVLNTYSPNDANLDGDVRYTGGLNDKNVVLNAVGLADPTVARSSHLPN